jgi:hypothetical protein
MHAFAAPAVSPWSVHQALDTAREALLSGAPVLAAGLLALWVLGRSPASGALAAPLRAILGVALAAALVLAAKNGSARNYYLAAFEVSGLAAMLALCDPRVAAPRAARAIALLVALYGATAWAYVIAPGRVGALRLPAPSPELRRMVEAICAAPPPRLVESSYYALPHASCEYPIAVIDWTFYADAPASFPVLRVEDMVAARGYRSRFVQPGSALHRAALRAGYRCGAPIAELVPCAR